jgi:hypothetical protein
MVEAALAHTIKDQAEGRTRSPICWRSGVRWWWRGRRFAPVLRRDVAGVARTRRDMPRLARVN